MAPPVSKEKETEKDYQEKPTEQTLPNSEQNRAEKAKKMKEQLLSAQTQGSVAERTVANTSSDMSREEKQTMEKFFEWSPPPAPETMGQKFERKVKQNPFVPVGEY